MNFCAQAESQLSRPPQFTGKERDFESGLDYFGARYYANGLGRFSSPDPIAIFIADTSDPQTWNQYSYVRGNPVANIDPTGLSCVDTSNGKADDGDGKGCADAGVSPSTAEQRDRGKDIQDPQHADVSGKNPSELEYTWTMLTHHIPRYDPDDIPLSPYAQSVLNRLGKLIDDYPTVCGGGTYKYLGKEIDAGPFSGFAGVINESDSRTGASNGALFEGGGGEGVLGGIGYVASTTGGQPQGTGLVHYPRPWRKDERSLRFGWRGRIRLGLQNRGSRSLR
jgi:RHS repeat-associated protein